MRQLSIQEMRDCVGGKVDKSLAVKGVQKKILAAALAQNVTLKKF